MNEAEYLMKNNLWRSRRVLRPQRITPSEISIILHMIRKPNSMIFNCEEAESSVFNLDADQSSSVVVAKRMHKL